MITSQNEPFEAQIRIFFFVEKLRAVQVFVFLTIP